MSEHTTNYRSTFIEVSEDCPIDHGTEPPIAENLSIAALHYRLIAEEPYGRTSDDVIFETHALRKGIDPEDAEARAEFFSKGQPCLRSSDLGKRYGWGVHSDAEGRVALVGLGLSLLGIFLGLTRGGSPDPDAAMDARKA